MDKKLPVKDISIYSNRIKSRWKNDNCFRTLYESITSKKYLFALDDWRENCTVSEYILIDGLVYGYYSKPRASNELDLIFLVKDDVPQNIPKFKKKNEDTYIHIKTKVEVKVVNYKTLNKSLSFYNKILENSITSDDIRIASPESVLIYQIIKKSKRENIKYYSDLEISIIASYIYANNLSVSLKDYELTNKEKSVFEKSFLEKDYSYISENHHFFDLKDFIRDRKKVFEVDKYKIILFEDDYGEPKFIFTEEFFNNINKFDQFVFAVSLIKPFNDNGRIRVVLSTTNYCSFTKFKKEERILSDWLKDNIEMLREEWNKINKRKI